MSRSRAARRGGVLAAGVIGVFAAVGVAFGAADPSFSVSDDKPEVGEKVNFTAVADCGSGGISCEWDFGDGAHGSAKEESHKYDEVGSKTITLKVSDLTDPAAPEFTESSQTIEVLPPPPPPNKDPSVSVNADPSTALKHQVVNFTASGSDPDGDNLEYAWDLDGDDQYDDGGGPSASHSYVSSGTFSVGVKVSDGNGGSAFASTNVKVVNQAPDAKFIFTPPAPLSGEPVTFTSQSSDPDGDPISLAWALDPSGNFNDGSAPTVSRTYQVPGNKTVKLLVKDNDGGSAEAKAAFIVANRLPTANFSFAPDPAPVNREVTFTSSSTDPENRLAGQDWDLDGDGQYDDKQGATATTTFDSPAKRTIGLRVTDQDGGADERRVDIVPNNKSPQASFVFSPATPAPGVPVAFNATATDEDGTIAAYKWDFDDDEAFDDGAGAVVTHRFARPGSHQVSLEVTDDDGGTFVVTREVVVEAGGVAGVGSSSETTSQASGTAARARRYRLMRPFPVIRIAGELTRRGARFEIISIRAPRSARIDARCAGRDCPTKRRRQSARKRRLKAFERAYRAGTRLEIRVTQRRRIGKYARIVVRRGAPPARQDRCVWPGRTRPRSCPSP